MPKMGLCLEDLHQTTISPTLPLGIVVTLKLVSGHMQYLKMILRV